MTFSAFTHLHLPEQYTLLDGVNCILDAMLAHFEGATGEPLTSVNRNSSVGSMAEPPSASQPLIEPLHLSNSL
ncbi:MAG: hypothetical protein KME45_11450 [Stenomitos rutilans HA7619-LM2]|nr:hypothetical protein [Stenomitos rutilans HA7619-LM2]